MEFLLEAWDIILSGGWVMIPLFLLSILLYTQAFQLAIYTWRVSTSSGTRVQLSQWLDKPADAPNRVQPILRYVSSGCTTIKDVRNRYDEVRLALVSTIDRRVRFVNTLVSAAPLLGLLGTVLGMLSTFFGIATGGGTETAGAVANGISQALVTTQTGLTIALPGLFMVMLIQRQRSLLEAWLARLESVTLSRLEGEI
ncbi:MAG: MotA/TolQ/ExbB proton channel family protein [Opitutales bacterium]